MHRRRLQAVAAHQRRGAGRLQEAPAARRIRAACPGGWAYLSRGMARVRVGRERHPGSTSSRDGAGHESKTHPPRRRWPATTPTGLTRHLWGRIIFDLTWRRRCWASPGIFIPERPTTHEPTRHPGNLRCQAAPCGQAGPPGGRVVPDAARSPRMVGPAGHRLNLLPGRRKFETATHRRQPSAFKIRHALAFSGKGDDRLVQPTPAPASAWFLERGPGSSTSRSTRDFVAWRRSRHKG
jgi:hypothetical protein